MTNLRTQLFAARELGLSALVPYATYRIELAVGLTRLRTPKRRWSDRPFADWILPGIPSDAAEYSTYRAGIVGPRFFFDAASPGLPWPAKEPPPDLKREADEIVAGRFRLFGGEALPRGSPPDWSAFPPPLEDRRPFLTDRHWSRAPLDEAGADVRLLWELSRFGWVYPLARAYRWTGEEGYAEACWRLIDSWRQSNPPNHGVQWASAQEAALRLVALAFAERAFLPAWSRFPDRLQELAQLVAFHAARIPPTLNYARGQNNNHLLSEAAGLYTAGVLFPELRDGARWRRLGYRLLVHGFTRQVFDDGGYIQHSANYQRLALGLGVWSTRLAEVNGEPFPKETLGAIGRLARSLAVQSDAGGRSSAFGPDDGTNPFPLSSTDPGDSRPLVAAATRLVLGETWYSAGPWDETSAWLGLGAAARTEAPQPADLPETGFHYLRARHTRGSLRCVRFHERPGHSDQLHVDLWAGDRPLSFDPGSYLYNGSPPWQDGLSDSAVHNTPLVDNQEPMRRAGRFLWADRAQGRPVARWHGESFEAVRGEHDGYRRLGVTLSRTLARVEGGGWLIVDVARGQGRRRLTVGWNLPDLDWSWSPEELRLAQSDGDILAGWDPATTRAGLARAGEWVAGTAIDGPAARWGWTSPRYATLMPCLRLVLDAVGDGTVSLRTRFATNGSWPEAMHRLWTDPALLEGASSLTSSGQGTA